MCFLRLILQKNRPDKYWESNSCTTTPTLEQFPDTPKIHCSIAFSTKKTKWINNKHVSLKYFVPVLNIFRERWAWRSDWKRLSDSGWGRSLGLWWFSRMGTSSKFVHFLPLLLLLPFLLVGGESQNKNRGQIFLDCLHGKICRNCAKLFVALNCFKWYLKSQGTFENKTNLFQSKLCTYSET